MAGALAGFLLALHLASASAQVPVNAGSEMAACPSDLAEAAADKIRILYPNLREEMDSRRAATLYLLNHMRELFDPDGLGYLDLKRYSDFEWTSVLLTLPPRVCRASFEDWVLIDWGPKPYAEEMLRRQPVMRPPLIRRFRSLDRGNKGYIDRADWDQISLLSFRAKDKNRDGRVTFEEYGK